MQPRGCKQWEQSRFLLHMVFVKPPVPGLLLCVGWPCGFLQEHSCAQEQHTSQGVLHAGCAIQREGHSRNPLGCFPCPSVMCPLKNPVELQLFGGLMTHDFYNALFCSLSACFYSPVK